MGSFELTPIKEEERAGNNTLTDEATKRVINDVDHYLRKTGVVNVLKIAKLLGVMPGTAKNIVEKVHERWREHEMIQVDSQIQWIKDQMEELEKKKDEMVSFGDGERNAISHTEYIRLKQSLMEQLNKLQDVKMGESGVQDTNDVYVAMFKRVSPRTKMILDNDRETSQQDN